jgi:hypothetical protein
MAIENEVMEATKAELHAYLAGARKDATHSLLHRTLRFSQAGTEWLDVVQLILARLGRRAWMYRESNRPVWTLETSYACETPTLSWSKRAKVAYARGYFDAEGGIPRQAEARFYIQLVQKDLGDLSLVRRFLGDAGIECGKIHNPSVRVDPDYWRFFIRAASFGDFVTRISSWHPRKRALMDQRKRLAQR